MRDPTACGSRACLLLLLLTGTAAAQPPTAMPASARSIDLPEALVRAMAMNPMLTAYGFEVDAALGREQQAGLAPNPALNVSVEDGFGTGQHANIRNAETTVSLGFVLERGVRRRLVDAARAGVDVSRVDLEILRLDVAAETARRFLQCLAFQSRLVNAEAGVRLAREAVDAVGRRVAASRAPAAELARAQAELVRAELRMEDVEHELLSAYHRLSAQWGETEPDFDLVDGDLRGVITLDPFEDLVARVGENPDIVWFASQERLDETALMLARARGRQSWQVSGGLRRYEATDDFALVGNVTIPLPVRNRNQGGIAEARAELARTVAESDVARIRIETELFALYQELQHDVQLAERLASDVLPRIESALADTRRAFELGSASYLDLRAVQTELLDANDELLEAYIDNQRIVIEIERLTGERATPPVGAQRGQP